MRTFAPSSKILSQSSTIQRFCEKVIRISAAGGCKAMARDGTKLALFIDGVNTYAAARALGFDIDYKRLLTEFQSRGTLVRAFYYTVVIEDQEFSALRPLIDWLDYNGFTVVTKQ